MPHIHDLIDFTVVAYIVYGDKVLLVDHKEQKTWLPVGGHIELDEDPEQALHREIKEECGLAVEVIGERPDFSGPGTKALIAPAFMDIHDISGAHRHVGLVYFAKANSAEVTLADREHNNIRWFTHEDLSDPVYAIKPPIRFYAEQALERLKI